MMRMLASTLRFGRTVKVSIKPPRLGALETLSTIPLVDGIVKME